MNAIEFQNRYTRVVKDFFSKCLEYEQMPLRKITCYVLVGFNSTIEQDLFRLNTLKSLGITPFVQPYRDFVNKRKPKQYELDLARWANRMWLFKSLDFADFSPRKGFKCDYYLKQLA